jgi:kynurenine formamidase
MDLSGVGERNVFRRIIIGVAVWMFSTAAWALDVSNYRLVDLSHSYDDKTLYWPTSPSRFDKNILFHGVTDGGWFYSANTICTPEHGGTHFDAPLHFSASGIATDEMPLDSLIAPAVVIDISGQAESDHNYRLTAEDVRSFEKRNGTIEAGTIVLLRTGWSRFWPDAKTYLGDDTPGDAEHLQFPSYGEDAALLLIEQRKVAMLGVDTASIDYGQSRDFVVHRIAASKNVGGLENLTALTNLPATGSLVMALPMKIAGGSGGPARVVALVPRQDQ